MHYYLLSLYRMQTICVISPLFLVNNQRDIWFATGTLVLSFFQKKLI